MCAGVTLRDLRVTVSAIFSTKRCTRRLPINCVKFDSKKVVNTGIFSAQANAAQEYVLEYESEYKLEHEMAYKLANETAAYRNLFFSV